MGTGGYSALYRGMVPTLLREVPGSCVMFSAYEASKQFLAGQQVRRLRPGGLAVCDEWDMCISSNSNNN